MRALKTTGLILAAAGSLWASGSPAIPVANSNVVAKVNGEPVTQAELERTLANPLTLRQAQQELGVEKPDRKQLERLAMRKLVHLRLMIQEARRRDITVSHKELDAAITALRRRFDDLKSFGEWVRQQGLTDPSLFETVRADMLSDRLRAALVEGVQVSPEQTRQYYEANRNHLTVGEEVRLRILVVKHKAEAEEILAALRGGASFTRLARQHSLGVRATIGGDTGWVDSKLLPAPLHNAVALLKPGDVGGPLEKATDEFLLVGLQGRRPIAAKSFTEAQQEIERRLLAARQQEVVQAWLAQQEQKSTIEVFLPSERPGKGANKGLKNKKRKTG